MPRYFFDIHDGIVVTDQAGQDLPSLDAAHAHATQLTVEYVSSPRMIADDGGTLVVSIRDHSDTVLARHRLVFGIEHSQPVS